MRIGMLTSGGDCQALNATMRGVVKAMNTLSDNNVFIGFNDGYRGLIYSDYRELTSKDFTGILTVGGTILGTSRVPFKTVTLPDENGLDKVESMINTYKRLRLDCLVVLGGNGSLKTANLLSEKGLNVIGLPKTIDNDLYGTDMTFGFHSAVQRAVDAVDAIHTTANSHGRIFIVELMGHKVGQLPLYAGIASGADIILLPEIPYDIDIVCNALKTRNAKGAKFSIVAVAEGAISKEDAALEKKELKKKREKDLKKYPSVAYKLADEIGQRINKEIRIAVPGHTQRGGMPTPYDRVLSTRVGAHAAELIVKGKFGQMVCLNGTKISSIPLSKIAGKLKYVDPKGELVKQAKLIGINFGDE